MSYRGGSKVEFPITGGMDRSVSETASDPGGSMRTVMNARLDERGRWRKRGGYSGMNRSGGSPPNPTGAIRTIAEAGGSVLGLTATQVGTIDSGSAQWYATRESVEGLTEVPPRWALTGTVETAGSNAGNMELPSIAIGGGLEVHVWKDTATTGGALFVAVYDSVTGGMVTPPTVYATGYWGRIVYGQSRFCLIAWNSSGDVYADIFNVADLRGQLTTQPTLIGSDLSTTYKHADLTDAGYNDTERFFCAYPTTTGVRIREIARSGAVVSTPYTASYIGGAQKGVSITGTYGRDRVWACSVDTATGLQLRTFVGQQSDNLATAASTALYASATAVTSTGCCAASVGVDTDAIWLCSWLYDVNTYKLSGALYHGRVYYSGGVSYRNPMLVESVGPSSQPMLDLEGRVVCWVDLTVSVLPSSTYPTGYTFAPFSCFALLELIHDSTADTSTLGDVSNNSGARQVMLVAGQGRAYKHASTIFGLEYATAPKVGADPLSYQRAAALTVRGAGGSYTWDTVAVMAARFREMSAVGDRPVAEDVGGQLVVSGGCTPCLWDGRSLAELGFIFPPVIHSVTLDTTGGFIPASAAHQYAVVYEFTDAQGNLHQSAPVYTTTFTHGSGTSTNKATIVVNTLKLTGKAKHALSLQTVSVVLYRTTTGPGSVFYRLFGAAGVGINPNDPQANTVTFVDTLNDNGLDVATLYSPPVGGELANECPPAMVHAVPFGGRVAGIDASGAQDRIVFSKPRRAGRGIEWSSLLEQYVRGIGQLTGLVEMDGTLFAFGRAGVAIAAFGDGQDATGAGSWPLPQIISRTATCSGPWALARTAVGAIFAGRSGPPIPTISAWVAQARVQIWLLPRGGGEPVDIGAKLQPILDGNEPLTRFGETIARFDPAWDEFANVLSIVDWPEQTRAIVLVSSGTATLLCEYDYGSPGPDGIGAWSISTVADDHVAIVTAQGHVLGTHVIGAYASSLPYFMGADALTHTDTLYGTGAAEPVYMYHETHGIQPDGQQPAGRAREVSLEYAVDETTAAPLMTLGVCMAGAELEQDTSWVKTTWEPDADASPLTATMANPFGRDETSGAGIRVAWGTGKITGEGGQNPPDDSADLPPLSVSVEYLPRPGAARTRTTGRR
ncbi:MAG: hypothetical protein FJ027_19280 [Candidatus Rokubacteria bacterium]|nr:hypothetical protein [Candidatus Rokubacteria bacterium]